MAVASNDYATGTVRVATTPDGGVTWYSSAMSRTVGNHTFFSAQDPSLAFDSLGHLSAVYAVSNLNDSSNAIVMSESSDLINFNPPSAITYHLASDQVIDSRPVVAIKPGAGRYVAWDSLSTATFRYSINITRSDEGGLFGPVTTVIGNGRVSSPALALTKSTVYAGWDDWGFNSISPFKTGGRLQVASSPSGPQISFGPPQTIAETAIGFGQKIPAMPDAGVGPRLGLTVDPNLDSLLYAVFTDKGNGIPGLEGIDSFDVMVLFTRRIVLPENQLTAVKKYITAGKPIVGIRTASHGRIVIGPCRNAYSQSGCTLAPSGVSNGGPSDGSESSFLKSPPSPSIS